MKIANTYGFKYRVVKKGNQEVELFAKTMTRRRFAAWSKGDVVGGNKVWPIIESEVKH